MIVAGSISVKAVLLSGSRPIKEIYVDKSKETETFHSYYAKLKNAV